MKYYVTAQITVSTYTIVEAESEEEAIEEAEKREVMAIPYLNKYQYNPYEMWLVEELDGEPMKLEAEPKQ